MHPDSSPITDALASLWAPDDPRFFKPILRSSDGPGTWRTLRGPHLTAAAIAALVTDPGWIVGVRHRALTRVLAFDIDAHLAAPSPYWHPDGPDASEPMQRLLAAVEATEAVPTVVRSSWSGGWHLLAVLPEPIPASEAAHLAAHLAGTAGLERKPGHLETFPQPVAFEALPAWQRTAHNGIRLPGQQGSALWVAGRGWRDIEDPEVLYASLLADAELAAEAAASPAWLAARVAAQAARRAAEPRHSKTWRKPARSVVWTGPGQSHRHLGVLANDTWSPGIDVAEHGAAIARAAAAAPGFDTHASPDTKARLDRWALDWARSCARKPPARRSRRSLDPARNDRLRRAAVLRIIDGAAAVVSAHGPAVLDLGERPLAAAFGIARATLRKHWDLIRNRLAAAVFGHRKPGAGTGLHPCLKWLHASGHLQASGCPGCSIRIEDPCLQPEPGRRNAAGSSPNAANPPPLGRGASASVENLSPLRPLPPDASDRRRAEHAELLAWLR